jgi:hypothetical protein
LPSFNEKNLQKSLKESMTNPTQTVWNNCYAVCTAPDVFSAPRCNPLDLEYLAIAQRPDQRYEIIISGFNETMTEIIFETSQYCMEAAAEIKQQFDMSRFLSGPSGETLEIIEAIVRGYQWRGFVGRSLGVA